MYEELIQAFHADIRNLAKHYPNDMDFGGKVREYLLELDKATEKLLKDIDENKKV
jgi:hypothetical protein